MLLCSDALKSSSTRSKEWELSRASSPSNLILPPKRTWESKWSSPNQMLQLNMPSSRRNAQSSKRKTRVWVIRSTRSIKEERRLKMNCRWRMPRRWMHKVKRLGLFKRSRTRRRTRRIWRKSLRSSQSKWRSCKNRLRRRLVRHPKSRMITSLRLLKWIQFGSRTIIYETSLTMPLANRKHREQKSISLVLKWLDRITFRRVSLVLNYFSKRWKSIKQSVRAKSFSPSANIPFSIRNASAIWNPWLTAFEDKFVMLKPLPLQDGSKMHWNQ